MRLKVLRELAFSSAKLGPGCYLDPKGVRITNVREWCRALSLAARDYTLKEPLQETSPPKGQLSLVFQ
eukprot:1518446-Amphidinium_carterae.1